MAWTTGALSGFHNKDIVDEKIGEGDGSTTNFTIDLSGYPIFLDTFTFDYEIGGTPYTATTDAAGNITGTNVSGTIDEAGDGSVAFTSAPDNGDLLAGYRTKGFVQKIIDFCTVPPHIEAIGTGNGTQKIFPFTLTTPGGDLAEGQTRIRFKIGLNEYEVWDDGNGSFNHNDHVEASTIDKTTKAGSIEFKEAVPDGFVLTALSVSGAPGQDWILYNEHKTLEADTVTEAFPGELLKAIIIKNSGSTYRELITVGVRETKQESSSFFSLNLAIHYAGDETTEFHNIKHVASYDSNLNSYTYLPQLPLDNIDLVYWIFSSKNRIIGVVKSSGGVYSSFYAGAGERFSDPASYPRNIVCISSATENLKVTSLDSKFAGLLDKTSIVAYDTDGNRISNAYGNDYLITSHHSKGTGANTQSKTTLTNGKVPMVPVQVYTDDDANRPGLPLMQLEGVFSCFSNTVASEHTLNDNKGYENIVFQESFKTAAYNYFCVRKN